MRSTAVLGLLSLVLASVACSSPAPEQTGASRASITGGACTASRDEILASTSAARQNAIQRGFAWLDANVPYSQSKSYEGYRTDCSGFVSMCWELGTSTDTAALYAGGTYDANLGSWDDLLPADALVHRSGGKGHVVLFLGWEPDKSGVCVLEQASTASGMQFRVRSLASLQSGGFKPIRANVLADDTGSADARVTTPAAPADGTGTAAEGDAPPAVDTSAPTDPSAPPSSTPASGTCVPFAALDVCNEAMLTRGVECGTVQDNCGNDVDCDAVPSFGCTKGETCSATHACVKAVKPPTTTEPPAPSGSVPPVGDPGDDSPPASAAAPEESAKTPGPGAASLPKSHVPSANAGCSASSSVPAGPGGHVAPVLALVAMASIARRRRAR